MLDIAGKDLLGLKQSGAIGEIDFRFEVLK